MNASCLACRPHWQKFRRTLEVAGVAPDRRPALIREYLLRLHDHDHDVAALRAELERERTVAMAAAAAREVLAARLDRELRADGPD